MTKEEIIGNREERLKRIGGSEFGTIMEVNPYSKRIDLVLEKAGIIASTFEGNAATRRGEFLEDEVVARFEDETGLEVTNQQDEFIDLEQELLDEALKTTIEVKKKEGRVWKNDYPAPDIVRKQRNRLKRQVFALLMHDILVSHLIKVNLVGPVVAI